MSAFSRSFTRCFGAICAGCNIETVSTEQNLQIHDDCSMLTRNRISTRGADKAETDEIWTL